MNELKTMIFNWSSGGLIYEKNLKSIGITIKPDKYMNYLSFSIQFGSYNHL